MKTFKRVCNIVSTVLLSLVVLVVFLLVGVRIFGLTSYTVLSGSMEPNYHVGSIVYVREVDPFSLQEKDVITYKLGSGTIVTHRIIEVIYDEENPTQVFFRTKGDNNQTEDKGEPIPASNVLGKVCFTIPLLGYVAYAIQTPIGRGVSVGLCLCLLSLLFLPDLLEKWLQEEEKNSIEKTDENSPEP